MFSSYTPKMDSNENILFGDNSKGDVIGLGKVAIGYNLLSVSQLCKMGFNCLFTDKGVEIFRREDSYIVFTR